MSIYPIVLILCVVKFLIWGFFSPILSFFEYNFYIEKGDEVL